ncbi:DNA photolyase family protein [Fulvivirgaceae bacterium PWU5]|uniref:DNA photolyase family protein n=1 Tax=Dawidia cretensis TaxID=2782350 RepID=A0AAP2DV45_9BACT|nr:DNA photolyase family protein [Dawidia cretensis]
MGNDTTIFWFRRDLRLTDNAGLYHALRDNEHVVPVFIFDTVILDALEDIEDRRVEFIHQTLAGLKAQLEALGSSLVILHGNPVTLYRVLHPRAVYTNHDYEPYARERDGAIQKLLEKKGIGFHAYKDQVIFEKDEVVKDDGKPYTVFTPYSRKWKAALTPFYLKRYPVEKYTGHFKKIKHQPFPGLEDIGFQRTGAQFPERVIRTGIIEKYDRTRDFPDVHGTTRLSVHLRFGTVSIRKLCQVAQQKNQVWLNELIWREFYAMILWHFPHVQTESFKPKYDRIAWRNDPAEFDLWCTGQTGYPIVDAGMRELNATGFMHNRVRMITASFLTKHLLIDWRWGEAYFGQKLLDYDLASNNGGWQWAAGSGCDAAPYFRVFNPALQTKKFDPDHAYIKKWVPEYQTDAYARPVVEHALARQRALNTYKKGLG